MTEQSGPPSLAAEAEPFLRGLIGAVALLLVVRTAEPLFFGDSFYTTLAIHPFWIVVILAAVQGGFFVGVATAAAAAMLMDWPPRPIGVDITAHYVGLAIIPVQWLLAAIVIGTFRQGQIRREAWLAAENFRLRQMSEDLAKEVERMDGEVAALELHAATKEPGGAAPDARPGGNADRSHGDAGAPEPGLAALSVLATAGPDAFEIRFAEAASALGFAGAAFHVGMCVPVRAGAAPYLLAQDAERLRRLVAAGRVVEAGTAEAREVAIGVGEDGLLATVTLCRSPTPDGGAEDRRGDGRGERAKPAERASAMPAAEATARTALLAAAVAFSGFRPANYLTPVVGTATRRSA